MLASLSKMDLIKNFGELVRTERKITAEIVDYIKEIDSRKIYLDLGFTSLFAYLTDGAGYTAASAQRRIDSARLLRDLPELKTEIESGALNLMQLAVVAQSVRAKEKKDLAKVTSEYKKQILKKVQHQNLFETQTTVSQFFDLKLQQAEKVRPQSDDSVRLELTLTVQEFKDLERVKQLLSSTHQHLTNQQVLAILCQDYLKRKDPAIVERRVQKRQKASTGHTSNSSAGANPISSAGPTPILSTELTPIPSRTELTPIPSRTELTPIPSRTELTPIRSRTEPNPICSTTSKMEVAQRRTSPSHSRHLPAGIRRSVLARDGNCQWIDEKTSKKCGSCFDLEVDHKQSRWAGGSHSPDNLQVLCRVHNQLKYKLETQTTYASKQPLSR